MLMDRQTGLVEPRRHRHSGRHAGGLFHGDSATGRTHPTSTSSCGGECRVVTSPGDASRARRPRRRVAQRRGRSGPAARPRGGTRRGRAGPRPHRGRFALAGPRGRAPRRGTRPRRRKSAASAARPARGWTGRGRPGPQGCSTGPVPGRARPRRRRGASRQLVEEEVRDPLQGRERLSPCASSDLAASQTQGREERRPAEPDVELRPGKATHVEPERSSEPSRRRPSGPPAPSPPPPLRPPARRRPGGLSGAAPLAT